MNGDPGFRRFAQDTSYTLIRQAWAVILGLLISILLARGLGKELRGVYTVVLLLPATLTMFLDPGIGPATAYFTSQRDRDLNRIAQNNFALSIWISLAGLLAGFLLVRFAGDLLFPGATVTLLLVGLALFPLNLQKSYLLTIFQGLQDFRAFNLAPMLSQLALLVLAALFIWVFDWGVIGALAASIGSEMVGLGLLLYFLSRRVSLRQVLHLKPDRGYTRRVFQYGVKVYFANLLGFLNYRADVFLLNLLGGVGLVGLYSVGVSLAERFWLLPSAVSMVLLPRIASLEGDEAQRKFITPVMSRYVFFISLLAAVPVLILAPWMMTLLYSPEFSQSAVVLRLLLPGVVAGAVTKIVANDIAGRGRPEINLRFTGMATAANITANLFLIPSLGIAGAAISSSISYTLLMVLEILAYRRLTGTPLKDLFWLKKPDVQRLSRAILRRSFSESS